MNLDEIRNRKGAVRTSDVPAQVRELLNKGLISTVNLNENLVVDSLLLFENVMNEVGFKADLERLKSELAGQKILVMSKSIGKEIVKACLENRITPEQFEILKIHTSDTVRNWCAFAVGYFDNQLEEKFKQIKRFASDDHMGVREMAWLAMREDIGNQVEKAIQILIPWTADSNHYIRRFASEATRPRGVWCKHIDMLKQTPEIGLKILEPLRSDKLVYVQDSVSNWLNDASKTRPDWVLSVTKRWLEESPCKETERICKRAVRSI